MSLSLYNQLVSQSKRLSNRTNLTFCSKRQVGYLSASSKSRPIEGTTSPDEVSPESVVFSSGPTKSSPVYLSTRANQVPKKSYKRLRHRTQDYSKDRDLEQIQLQEEQRNERREMFASLSLRLRPKKTFSEDQPLYCASSKNFFNKVSIAQYQRQSSSAPSSTARNASKSDDLSSSSWRSDRDSFSVADSPRIKSKKAVAGWPVTDHPGLYRPLNWAYAIHNKTWHLSLSAFISPEEDAIPDSFKVKPEKGRMMLLSKRSLLVKTHALRHLGWELVDDGTRMRRTIENLTDRETQRWLGLSESKIKMLVVQWLSLIGQNRKHDPDEVFIKGSTLTISLQTHEARTEPTPSKVVSIQSPTSASGNLEFVPSSADLSTSERAETSTSISTCTPGITAGDIALAWSIEAFLKEFKMLGSKPHIKQQTQPFEWTE